jgi:hypothetical protein
VIFDDESVEVRKINKSSSREVYELKWFAEKVFDVEL